MTIHNQERYNMVRKAIALHGTRAFTVDYTKKNGDASTMSALARVTCNLAGDTASASAKQAVASRVANNPNLLNLVNFSKISRKGDKGWRSIDMNRPFAITFANGVSVEYMGE